MIRSRSTKRVAESKAEYPRYDWYDCFQRRWLGKEVKGGKLLTIPERVSLQMRPIEVDIERDYMERGLSQ